MSKKPVVLIIRDGWGVNPGGRAKAVENGDATLLAHTPFHDYVYATYPHGTLSASGLDVGLPDGQMGNSEVGHLNLGAGRIVYQDLTRINKAIADAMIKLQAVSRPHAVVNAIRIGVAYFATSSIGRRRRRREKACSSASRGARASG